MSPNIPCILSKSDFTIKTPYHTLYVIRPVRAQLGQSYYLLHMYTTYPRLQCLQIISPPPKIIQATKTMQFVFKYQKFEFVKVVYNKTVK